MPNAKARAHPAGGVTLELESGKYLVDFGHNEIADADDYLGREFGRPTSFLSAWSENRLSMSLLRVAFYYATRLHAKDIRSVAAAGQLYTGREMEKVADAIGESLEANGIMGDAESAGES